jgi:hypothetical protein
MAVMTDKGKGRITTLATIQQDMRPMMAPTPREEPVATPVAITLDPPVLRGLVTVNHALRLPLVVHLQLRLQLVVHLQQPGRRPGMFEILGRRATCMHLPQRMLGDHRPLETRQEGKAAMVQCQHSHGGRPGLHHRVSLAKWPRQCLAAQHIDQRVPLEQLFKVVLWLLRADGQEPRAVKSQLRVACGDLRKIVLLGRRALKVM